jgi:formiminotetrahydrofolate cyclodeaminase
MHPTHLFDAPIDVFLTRVGDASPEPGAGAVAALTAGAAAGLVEMAARATEPDWGDAIATAAQAKALRRRLVSTADANAEAYRAARHALAQTRTGTTRGGGGSFTATMTISAELLVDLASAAADVAVLGAETAERCVPDLRPDAAAAVALADAAVRAAAVLARANLVTGGPSGSTDEALVAVERLAASALRRVTDGA